MSQALRDKEGNYNINNKKIQINNDNHPRRMSKDGARRMEGENTRLADKIETRTNLWYIYAFAATKFDSKNTT